MKKTLLAICFLLPLICLAEKRDMRKGSYTAHLYDVEPFGKNEKTIIDTVKSVFQDSLIKIDWVVSKNQLDFNISNETEQTIKIIWDDAAYISINNETGKIFHKGIKYIDREASQPPTAIYKGTTLSDLIAPTSFVYYESGKYGGWRSSPLIPAKGNAWFTKVEYEEVLIGATMKVVLPIKVGEKIIEYIFSFRTEFVENK